MRLLHFLVPVTIACGAEGEFDALQRHKVQELAAYLPSSLRGTTCGEPNGQLRSVRGLQIEAASEVGLQYAALLQYYYWRYGLEFQVSDVRVPEISFALDDDREDLKTAVAAEFPHVELDGDEFTGSDQEYEELVTFIGNHTLAPIVEFAHRHSASQETHLVFLRTLRRGGFDDLLALSVSKTLVSKLAGTDLPEAATWTGIEFPAVYPAMVFISVSALSVVEREYGPVGVALVLAHEFAHTLGLTHTSQVENLMRAELNSGPVDCSVALTSEQLEFMREQL